MQRIEYVCINQNYQAHFTVQRLTKVAVSEKWIEEIEKIVYCTEYLDENGIRFYSFDYETKTVAVWGGRISKQFDPGIVQCSVEFLEGPKSSFGRLSGYGFHKDDLKLPEPLWYLISDYGDYHIVGPMHSRRDDYWSSIHRDCNGHLIPDEKNLYPQKTIATSAGSSTPKPCYVTTNSILGYLMYVCPANPYNLHGSVVNFITRVPRSCVRAGFVIMPNGHTNENGQPLTEKDIWYMSVLNFADRITDFVEPNDGLPKIPIVKEPITNVSVSIMWEGDELPF